jgi:hypothetical protein
MAGDERRQTMRWHSNTDLFSIEEANLVSARRHGVDLDLPTLWYALLGTDALAPARPDRSSRYDLVSRTELLKNRLRAVIVHAWPGPHDPVVVALREEAMEMMEALDRLREQMLK